jgi:2-C-methyl-D-erythritol 2,4-cyclodiphosphate synthase
MRFRAGQGFDFHPLEAGRKLILGGVEIAHTAGLRGHSDADIAAHALANAILGALGEGDLGQHFPDNDARYQNADSIALLETVWKRATDLGWSLVNADLTIFAAQPKLAPHLPAMRARLAAALSNDATLLNVKASNPEGLGALGRGEGMAAAAIVMLQAG